MSMPNPADMVTWTVTGQTERDQIVPGGPPAKGQQIYFTTGNGQQGSVFIPYTQYANTDYVRGEIAKMAAQLDAVKALTGGPGY